jgi:hypothetical protein
MFSLAAVGLLASCAPRDHPYFLVTYVQGRNVLPLHATLAQDSLVSLPEHWPPADFDFHPIFAVGLKEPRAVVLIDERWHSREIPYDEKCGRLRQLVADTKPGRFLGIMDSGGVAKLQLGHGTITCEAVSARAGLSSNVFALPHDQREGRLVLYDDVSQDATYFVGDVAFRRFHLDGIGHEHPIIYGWPSEIAYPSPGELHYLDLDTGKSYVGRVAGRPTTLAINDFPDGRLWYWESEFRKICHIWYDSDTPTCYRGAESQSVSGIGDAGSGSIYFYSRLTGKFYFARPKGIDRSESPDGGEVEEVKPVGLPIGGIVQVTQNESADGTLTQVLVLSKSRSSEESADVWSLKSFEVKALYTDQL